MMMMILMMLYFCLFTSYKRLNSSLWVDAFVPSNHLKPYSTSSCFFGIKTSNRCKDNKISTILYQILNDKELDNDGIINDKLSVAVIGATGGVGQLITARLINEAQKVNSQMDYDVIAIGKDQMRLDSLYNDNKEIKEESKGNVKIQTIVADTKDLASLYAPLKDVDIVVIATGTSAFPSPRWKNNNTPDNVDRKGVMNILKSIKYTNAKRSPTSKLKKKGQDMNKDFERNSSFDENVEKKKIQMVVFLSSIGVTRTKSFPFFILNSFGVLDAKRDAEIAIQNMSEEEGFDYMIVRPGRLVGGPWTNTDVANLLKTQEGNKKQIQVEVGDSLNGDAAR